MRRRWIIPDIHGCINTLTQLIEYNIKLTKEDAVYFLGDYIDRGPDGKGVIDYIINLKEQGYDINYLIGNHEDYCINTYNKDQGRLLFKSRIQKEWESHGGKATLESFGVKRARDIDKKYIDFMRNGKFFIELEDYILVHAGMNFNIANPFEDTKSMLWARDFKVDPMKIGAKKIIHGHIPVEYSMIDLFVNSDEYNFIALDNGVYYQNKAGFGNLMAFDLDSKKLIAQPNIDF
ncbi:MAG: metallophosphoesterase family protein [Candidatus Limimorpha sp.]